jgi:hypothetical protein
MMIYKWLKDKSKKEYQKYIRHQEN